MENALVIGGTGFIGSHIANFLVDEGYDVSVLGFSKRKQLNYFLNNKVNIFFANLSNFNELQSCGIIWKFNLVINCGGYVNHNSFSDTFNSVIGSHLIGTLNLLKLLDDKQLKKYIHLGSSDEYGDLTTNCEEDMRESPLTPYSFSKVASTHLLQMLAFSEQFPSVVVRPFLVYGETQKSNRLIPFVIDSCLKNKRFEVTDGKQVRDFLYIKDFVEAINCIIQAPIEKIRGKIYNVSSGESITVLELINLIVEITGGGVPLYGKKRTRKTEAKILKSHSNKFKSDFNWEPKINLKSGISLLVEYLSRKKI